MQAENLSAKEKVALLIAARKASWEECLPIIRDLTEPCFRIRITRHKDGSRTVEPDIGRPSKKKSRNAFVIHKNGKLVYQGVSGEPNLGYSPPVFVDISTNTAIVDICKRHASALYELIGNKVQQGKYLYTYESDPQSYCAGDYGFSDFIGLKYGRGMQPRIQQSSVCVMRKALLDNLNQDALMFSRKVGATFKKVSSWIEANNLIVDFLPLYRRVQDDQPRAIPLFHAALLDAKKRNDLPTMNCEPIKWAKDVLREFYGLSSPSWRRLLSCNAAERTAWLSLPLRHTRIALLNRVTERQVPVTATLASIYGDDGDRCDTAREHLLLDYKESLLRHLHAMIKKRAIEKCPTIRDGIRKYETERLRSSLVFDYIVGSEAVLARPKGAGIKWWDDTQAAWHANIAIIEAKRGRRLFDWTDAYPAEIHYFEKDGMKAHIISTTHRLIQEGLDMHHCVALYDGQCLEGEEYIYSITFNENGKDGRATSRVSVREGHGVNLTECRSHHNGNVSSVVHDFATEIANRLRVLLASPVASRFIPNTLMLYGVSPKVIADEQIMEEVYC